MSDRITDKKLFLVTLTLLLMSLGLIFFGITRIVYENEDIITNNTKIEMKGFNEEEVSLSDYFSNNRVPEIVDSDDYYLQIDPFRETCSQAPAGKKPYIISGTVCYR